MGADAIDARLHDERVDPATRAHRLHEAPFAELPDGAFVLEAGAPSLVLGAQLLEWTPAGYAGRRPRPTRGEALVITPPSLLEVWRSTPEGAVPRLHPSAR